MSFRHLIQEPDYVQPEHQEMYTDVSGLLADLDPDDPGIVPFLESLGYGFEWWVAMKYLPLDDPRRETLQRVLDKLDEAHGPWRDNFGRAWPHAQIHEALGVVRRGPTGAIASVIFPDRVDALGNAHYPEDRTAEHVAELHRRRPVDPAEDPES